MAKRPYVKPEIKPASLKELGFSPKEIAKIEAGEVPVSSKVVKAKKPAPKAKVEPAPAPKPAPKAKAAPKPAPEPAPQPKPVAKPRPAPKPKLEAAPALPQTCSITVTAAREVSAGLTTLHVNGQKTILPLGVPVTINRDLLPALASAGVDFVEG